MPRNVGFGLFLLVLVGCAAAFGSQRLVMRSEAPAPPPEPRQPQPEIVQPPNWTRMPTPVTRVQDYQRLPALPRPADVNPFDPTLAPRPVSRVEPLQPEDVRPESARVVRAAARDPRAERRRAQARAAAAQRLRDARRAPVTGVASSAALGVSPHYDLVR